MIQIEGLSPKQHIIADAIWECDSTDELITLFEVFPMQEVITVKEMMIAATMDTIVNDDVDEAKQYLQRFQ